MRIALAEPVPENAREMPELDVSGAEEMNEGVALYESGQPQLAAEKLALVVESHPQNARAWLFLGLARFDSGQNVPAEQAAMKALEVDSGNARAVMLLAAVYIDGGDRAKADAQLRRYLELEPDGAFADDAKRLITK
jgi:Flp pilus assembly protein TadD